MLLRIYFYFEIVCGVFWGVSYNSFSQLFYQNFIRLA